MVSPTPCPDGRLWPLAKPGEIRGGDQPAPGDIFEVAWELGPEGRLERDLLPHRDDAEIGQRRSASRPRRRSTSASVCPRTAIVRWCSPKPARPAATSSLAPGTDRHAGSPPRPRPSASAAAPGSSAQSAAWRSTKPKLCEIVISKGRRSNLVEHAGRRLAGIVLDRDDRREAARAGTRGAELDGLPVRS